MKGVIRSLLAYKILVTAIPIMAQQMSLLVNVLPLDGMMAQNGPVAVKKFVHKNNRRLRSWSMLNPTTINSYGEIVPINRSFTDFDSLNMALRQDVSVTVVYLKVSYFIRKRRGLVVTLMKFHISSQKRYRILIMQSFLVFNL